MTAFEDQHSVWVETTDPEWFDKNGTWDMRLVHGVALNDARLACLRLLTLRLDLRFWITNIHGDTVEEFTRADLETRPPLQSSAPKPRRRALGKR